MKYFSKTTSGFYDDEIHQTMPNDAVQITQELYESLINGQATGKVIASDETGNPILIESVHNAPEYYQLRSDAYPSIVDQLDLLYHQGYDGWKSVITQVKDQYPKP